MGDYGALSIKEIKDGYGELLSAYDFNLFLTLNFHDQMMPERAQAKLRLFDAAFNRRLLGRKWSEKLNEDRLFYFAAAENLTGNAHWHLLVLATCPAKARAIGKLAWDKVAPEGSYHAKIIGAAPDPQDYRKTVTKYVTKQFANEKQYEIFTLPHSFSNQ